MDTLELIHEYNTFASGIITEADEQWARQAIMDLSLDPVNLAEYPAVTDLPFKRAPRFGRQAGFPFPAV